MAGGGAGLEDYWKATVESPFGAGGFIWALLTKAWSVRTKAGGWTCSAVIAPDGLVGPHHEKEGSFYAVRDIWSPVQMAAPVLDEHFDGAVAVRNRYSFTSLDQCRFEWQLLRFPDPAGNQTAAKVLAKGLAASPSIVPGAEGQLRLGLPAGWADSDALALTAYDPAGASLWTWTWPAPGLAKRLAAVSTPSAQRAEESYRPGEHALSAGRAYRELRRRHRAIARREPEWKNVRAHQRPSPSLRAAQRRCRLAAVHRGRGGCRHAPARAAPARERGEHRTGFQPEAGVCQLQARDLTRWAEMEDDI